MEPQYTKAPGRTRRPIRRKESHHLPGSLAFCLVPALPSGSPMMN